METKTVPFIEYLATLRDDRGALAALRHGLGQPPGTVPDTFRYVVPWLPAEVTPRQEAAYYLVATLFAYHPLAGGTGNMGRHFTLARDPQGDNAALERRFTALLAAHPDDLPFYLRQAVSFLRSKEIPVAWDQLFFDILAWGHPDRYVQRQWANTFWGRLPKEA